MYQDLVNGYDNPNIAKGALVSLENYLLLECESINYSLHNGDYEKMYQMDPDRFKTLYESFYKAGVANSNYMGAIDSSDYVCGSLDQTTLEEILQYSSLPLDYVELLVKDFIKLS